MKKISLFAVAIAICFAGFAQTTPAKKDTKTPAKTEKKASKKADTKKTDAKTTVTKSK